MVQRLMLLPRASKTMGSKLSLESAYPVGFQNKLITSHPKTDYDQILKRHAY
jgi:hypothetical protein